MTEDAIAVVCSLDYILPCFCLSSVFSDNRRTLTSVATATKFDLGEEELETFRQSFSRETADEEKDVQHPQENLDPISDDEEDPRIESREVEINAHVATGLDSGREQLDLLQGSSSEGEEVLGITRESGDDDDGEHPLPRDHSLKRSSGRNTKEYAHKYNGSYKNLSTGVN
ncbi:unnamed protein product [Penicillium palitans]